MKLEKIIIIVFFTILVFSSITLHANDGWRNPFENENNKKFREVEVTMWSGGKIFFKSGFLIYGKVDGRDASIHSDIIKRLDVISKINLPERGSRVKTYSEDPGNHLTEQRRKAYDKEKEQNPSAVVENINGHKFTILNLHSMNCESHCYYIDVLWSFPGTQEYEDVFKHCTTGIAYEVQSAATLEKISKCIPIHYIKSIVIRDNNAMENNAPTPKKKKEKKTAPAAK